MLSLKHSKREYIILFEFTLIWLNLKTDIRQFSLETIIIIIFCFNTHNSFILNGEFIYFAYPCSTETYICTKHELSKSVNVIWQMMLNAWAGAETYANLIKYLKCMFRNPIWSYGKRKTAREIWLLSWLIRWSWITLNLAEGAHSIDT